jgi:hypothetical protein
MRRKDDSRRQARRPFANRRTRPTGELILIADQTVNKPRPEQILRGIGPARVADLAGCGSIRLADLTT